MRDRALVSRVLPLFSEGRCPPLVPVWRAAYEVLSDSQKRRIYDVHGEDGVKQHSAGGGGGGGNSAQDIFSQYVALDTHVCMYAHRHRIPG